MKKLLAILLFSVALFTVLIAHPAYTANIENGTKVFKANCAMCHVGGGNVVNSRKTLKKVDLEKYNMYSAEAIVAQVTKGKDSMPSFKGRLNDSQIADVAAYVMEQAEKGWRK